MIPIDLAAAAAATGGRLVGGADPAASVTGDVVVDSRRAGPGALFVCLPGERVDGHEFAAAAIEAGAAAVVATRDVGVPAVLVDDAQSALAALAHAVLDLAERCTVVGVTGSVGKTSTKDLLADVFSAAGPTVAPEASFNNEIGMPLTVLRVTPQTHTLVAEYSARGRGHIRHLCGIARPRIGIVLNVGTAHLGEFGSREAVAAAKGELVEALPSDGTAVLNADDPLVLGMTGRTEAAVVTFGTAEHADVRLTDLQVDGQARPRFRLQTPAGPADVALALHGAHHATNAAAVVAAGLAAGLPLDTVVAALSRATPRSAHRMAVAERSDGLLIVDDAYNANPESVRAALAALAALADGRRRWAVLGPMRELGADSEALHAEVGAAAADSGVDELLVVGPDAAAIHAGATGRPGWSGRARLVPDAAAAAGLLDAEAGPGDAVLVKASNAEQLWLVAEGLLAGVPRGADR